MFAPIFSYRCYITFRVSTYHSDHSDHSDHDHRVHHTTIENYGFSVVHYILIKNEMGDDGMQKPMVVHLVNMYVAFGIL